jgi:hypothetical protein
VVQDEAPTLDHDPAGHVLQVAIEVAPVADDAVPAKQEIQEVPSNHCPAGQINGNGHLTNNASKDAEYKCPFITTSPVTALVWNDITVAVPVVKSQRRIVESLPPEYIQFPLTVTQRTEPLCPAKFLTNEPELDTHCFTNPSFEAV